MSRNRSITFTLVIAVGLALGAALCGVTVRAQDQPAGPAGAPDKPKPQADVSPATQQPTPLGGKSQDPTAQPGNGNDAPKPAAKAHHVVTNEDIEAQHELMASANSNVDIGNINDCDTNCFDWVRNSASYYLVRNTDWKRDLLRGIEQVTDDAKWQTALYQIARLKAKFCELSQNKNDALVDTADPKNMTENEIAIDEAYERKFHERQADLNAAYGNADAIIHSYSGVVIGFMNLQKQRAGNRTCLIRYPVMHPGYNKPLDDPDGP
jgi:hypothetical protein